MMLTIFKKNWRDHWKTFSGWTLGIVLMSTIELSVYPTLLKSGNGINDFMKNFPDSVQKIFHMQDYTSGPGFISTELFSLVLPMVIIAIGSSWGSSAVAGEEEAGTADLLFSLPVSRQNILLGKMFSIISALLAVGIVTYLTITVGSSFVNLQISRTFLASATVLIVLLGFFFSGVGLLIGAVVGKKALAVGITSGLALLMSIIYSLAPLVNSLDVLNKGNPFQWALGGRILFEGSPWQNFFKLFLVSTALYAASIFVTNNKDIRTQ
ncbi:MAG: ABC transporter permease subunit [Actinomycetes bacterium]